MIVRTWNGWTTPNKADDYEKLLREKIFPDIQLKGISGVRRIELLRLEEPAQTQFMTLFHFVSIEDFKLLAGADAEAAYVPDSAKSVLNRYDTRARHFESRCIVKPSS